MQIRDLARLLGALSITDRLMIIGCLIAAEDSGLSQLEICEITGLSPRTCSVQLEAMIQADITFKKSEKNNLTFYANFVVLGELFNHMCENFGYGLKKSAEKQNSELLNKPPFNQKKS
jgi:hypothetical protein